MTHEKDQNPDDLNWMDLVREDAIDEVRHTSKRAPFIAAALSLAILGGGAVFALSTNESPAQADDISTVVATPSVPVIPNVAPGDARYNRDDEEYEGYEEDDDHYEGQGHGDDDEHEDEDYEDEEGDD
jgi:hypothetical protein